MPNSDPLVIVDGGPWHQGALDNTNLMNASRIIKRSDTAPYSKLWGLQMPTPLGENEYTRKDQDTKVQQDKLKA